MGRMMLKIGDGLRSREIGFESKDWIHYVSVLLMLCAGLRRIKSEAGWRAGGGGAEDAVNYVHGRQLAKFTSCMAPVRRFTPYHHSVLFPFLMLPTSRFPVN
jgi:hypothetical protein